MTLNAALADGAAPALNNTTFAPLLTPPLIIQMKNCISFAINILLTIIFMASCGGYARNYKEPVIEEGTIRARKLLSLQQQREYDKLYLEAICQKQNGHIDAAYEMLQHALEINPNASEALYEIALMKLTLDARNDSILIKEGELMLQKAVQLEPSNPYFRSTLAERWVTTGKYARAARLYQQIVNDKPCSQDVALLTRLYEVLGDYPNAIKSLELLETLEGVNEKTTAEKFNILYESGDVAQAFGTVERVSEENPQELSYRVLLGDLYLDKGYKEKAIAVYEDAATTAPQNVLVRTSLLHYYLTENDTTHFNAALSAFVLDEKVEDETKFSVLQDVAGSILRKETTLGRSTLCKFFQQALTLPQQDSRIAELWCVYTKAAELPEEYQVPALKAVLAEAPEKIEVRMELMRYYIVHEDAEIVADLCVKGLQENPDFILFYYYGGMCLVQMERKSEAIKLLEEATKRIGNGAANEGPEIDSDIYVGIYTLLGDAYFEQDDAAKAFAAYDKALTYKPDEVGCLNNYAYYLAKKGVNLDKALNMSKKAIDMEPTSATYLDTYAWVLYCKRQYVQARIYIDKAIEALPADDLETPDSATYYDHAGDIYFRCGQKAKALEYWQHARQISDDDERNHALDKKLKNKRI